MILYGSKVLLRAIEQTDKDLLQRLMNDAEIEQQLGGWSFPVSDKDQEEWMKKLKATEDTLRLMIEAREEKIAVGTVILSNIDYKNGNAELHIKLRKEYSGKGYGTDTVNTIVAYAFHELRLHCIYAFILEYNKASQGLFKKCGFCLEGVLRHRVFKKGRYQDQFMYSILSEDTYGNRE